MIVRLIAVSLTTTVAADAPTFLGMARSMLKSSLPDALGQYRQLHPLYPLLISWIARLGVDLETAGYAVSILSGALLPLPIYFLVRSLWNERVARCAGMVAALHPVLARDTSEVAQTGLYLLLMVSGFTVLLLSFRSRPAALLLSSFAIAGLAFLTRPEGIYLVACCIVGLGVHAIRDLKGETVRRRTVLLSLGSVVLLAALIFPYLLWLRRETGKWVLTARPSAVSLWSRLSESFSEQDDDETPIARTNTVAARLIGKKVLRAFYSPVLPLVAAGLWWSRRTGGRWRDLWPLAALAALAAIPPILLFLLRKIPSHRYFLLSVTLLLPWGAALGVAAVDWIRARFPKPWLAPLLAAAAAAILILPIPRSRRADEASLIEAGRWLQKQTDVSPRRLVSTNSKISYYGGFEHISVPRRPWEEIWYLYRPEKDGPPSIETFKAAWDYPRRPGEVADIHINVCKLFDLYRLERASFLALTRRSLRHLHPQAPEMLLRLGFEPMASFPETPAEDLDTVWIFRRRTPSRQPKLDK